jgi:type II secretory pathway predicted ATPase ExeA
MSSIQSIAECSPAPFVGLPDPRFFYGNLANLEVLAGLRFGIEARKGLILFTGGPGTGKTTILHELRRELDVKVACILVGDPNLRLSEILRLILRHLGVAGAVDDDARAIGACRAALAAHAENNRIFSIAFDEAERLPDQTIDVLTQHFLGKGFDPASNLLQIVLAGRPELRHRMFMPPLSALHTQVEIECRLRPLDSRQIEHYIKHRLAAAELPVDLFDRAASERIATHSGGRPDFVNAICQRVLEETNANATAETLDAVLKDFELSRSEAHMSTAAPVANAAYLESTDISNDRSATVIARDIPENKKDNAVRYGTVALAVFFLTMFGIAAVWFTSEAPRAQLANWSLELEERATGQRDPSRADVSSADAVPEPGSETPPEPQRAKRQEQPLTETPGPSAKDGAASRASETLPYADRGRTVNDRSFELPSNPADDRSMHREPRIERTSDGELAAQITRAIANRALRGISVSVKDREAVLEGVVASEAQKQAAEAAVRDVPGLRSVLNRLTIE